jgi:2-polyprenyl-6-methoxyphenol hydroxylase-like FAD-dependent oxidoreductase
MVRPVMGRASFLGDHAVVLGGSMAGLVAARALSDHYRRVTLVERDRFPDGPETRKGVPQIRHVHVLLKRGELVLARMFPGLLEELTRGGAHCIDMAADTRWHHYGGWKTRFRSGMDFYCQSRPFLEWKVRGRVAALENVEIADGCDALGLTLDGDRVAGVRVRDSSGGESSLAADLVVDASGRGSRTPQWLASSGYPSPSESRVTVDVGYASRLYRPPAGAARSWKALFIYHRAPGTRLAVIVPVENGLWMVTEVGWFRDYPPGDDEGFLEFARSLPEPDVYDAIREAEPCSPIVVHRFPHNLRRHYEKLDRMPAGLVVLGDALCSFNPIYGQGMTSGALGAATLGEVLEESSDGTDTIGARFHARFGRILDGVWMQTTSEDLRFEKAQGTRAWWLGLANAYTAKVYERSRTDEVVSRAFLEVMHLMQPPASLLRPAILRRVLFGGAAGQAPQHAPVPQHPRASQIPKVSQAPIERKARYVDLAE